MTNIVRLSIFLLLFPLYLWPSGLPQLSAIFFAIVFVTEAQKSMTYVFDELGDIFKPLFAFVAYTFVVNVTWFVLLLALDMGSAPLFAFAIFYLYNAIAVAFVTYALRQGNPNHFRYIGYATVLTVFTQVAISFLQGGSGGRAEVMFNNPNQLGYFALLSATLIALTAKEQKKFFVVGVIGIIGCLYLAALSLSKAAMIGCLFLIALLTVLQPKRMLPLVVILVFAAGPRIAQSSLAQQVESRLDQVGSDGDDSAAGRGYDRILLYPEHLILGAGEGAIAPRFPALPLQGEMHSSFGTILFSYGIPGSLLFLAFLIGMIRKIGLIRGLYLVPALLYGLTHMGLRFTIFWVLLGYVLAISNPKSGPLSRTVFRLLRVHRPAADETSDTNNINPDAQDGLSESETQSS